MSEIEIQRRQEYKRNRKKWMLIQLVAIAVLVALALGSFLVYNRMNRTYQIEYMENSTIDYRVQYTENEFFTEEWLEKDQSYITSLTSNIEAKFLYDLCMATADMGFEYKYKIDAKLVVASKEAGTSYYEVEENLVPLKNASAQDTSCVQIEETVLIDFVKYNQIAQSFVDTYDLKNSTSTLIVTLRVEMVSTGKQIECCSENTYVTSLNIPLAEETYNIHSTSSSPANEIKVLEYQNAANETFFLVFGIVSASLALIAAVLLLVFLHLTTNDDITYAAKIRKILRAYGSYIQRMHGEFDYDGYQLVPIKTFNEMLGIRDTIQSPILMSENRDETMTRFLIPTNTKILYIFEIKVDNYDEIYGEVEEIVEEVIEEPVEEPVEEIVEEPVILEEVPEEILEEALAQPDIVLDEIEFVPDDDDQYEVAPEEPGIEVIGIVWPERAHKNKVYRYDPNGEQLNEGDIVLVPTRDVHKNREIVRKAAVAHANHRVDPEHIKHPLKKIIGILKRKVSDSLTPNATEMLAKKEAIAQEAVTQPETSEVSENQETAE